MDLVFGLVASYGQF